MAKQEMRDKKDDHESVQGLESGSSTVPTISFILGLVLLGMIVLDVSILILGMSGHVFMSYYAFVILTIIVQIVASTLGVVGLIFGIKGLQSTYTKRGRAVIGIILCAVSVIIGIGASVLVFGGGLGR